MVACWEDLKVPKQPHSPITGESCVIWPDNMAMIYFNMMTGFPSFAAAAGYDYELRRLHEAPSVTSAVGVWIFYLVGGFLVNFLFAIFLMLPSFIADYGFCSQTPQVRQVISVAIFIIYALIVRGGYRVYQHRKQ